MAPMDDRMQADEPAERWNAEDAKKRDGWACCAAASVVCTHTCFAVPLIPILQRGNLLHIRHLRRLLRCKWDWIAATPLGILCLPFNPDVGPLLCMPRCGVALCDSLVPSD